MRHPLRTLTLAFLAAACSGDDTTDSDADSSDAPRVSSGAPSTGGTVVADAGPAPSAGNGAQELQAVVLSCFYQCRDPGGGIHASYSAPVCVGTEARAEASLERIGPSLCPQAGPGLSCAAECEPEGEGLAGLPECVTAHWVQSRCH